MTRRIGQVRPTYSYFDVIRRFDCNRLLNYQTVKNVKRNDP